jgi:hypothetical protein
VGFGGEIDHEIRAMPPIQCLDDLWAGYIGPLEFRRVFCPRESELRNRLGAMIIGLDDAAERRTDGTFIC